VEHEHVVQALAPNRNKTEVSAASVWISLIRNLPKGWDEIFLEPWASREVKPRGR
jgi:hypothetical protein